MKKCKTNHETLVSKIEENYINDPQVPSSLVVFEYLAQINHDLRPMLESAKERGLFAKDHRTQ
jgi:hypothetical protein